MQKFFEVFSVNITEAVEIAGFMGNSPRSRVEDALRLGKPYFALRFRYPFLCLKNSTCRSRFSACVFDL